MNFRQRLLKSLYPTIMKLSAKGEKGKMLFKPKATRAMVSSEQLEVQLSSGKALSLASLRGRKVLLVNTASECGYTGQFAELQRLHEEMGEKLQIIGFPSNDFKEQEKGDDASISAFCQINFGVTFPLAKKSAVLRTAVQNPVFTWLTDPSRNGWNDQEPDWNFSKYLLNEQGELLAYFGPAVSPEDQKIKDLIG
jgi:glutathione peroxidase